MEWTISDVVLKSGRTAQQACPAPIADVRSNTELTPHFRWGHKDTNRFHGQKWGDYRKSQVERETISLNHSVICCKGMGLIATIKQNNSIIVITVIITII